MATDRTAAELREKNIARLSLASSDRTSTRVAALFDMQLRAMRRDRAARAGAELFLYDRIFQDCLERIASLGRKFERALLIGCPDPNSPKLLAKVAAEIDVRDPGPLFARAAAGETLIEDAWEPLAGAYDVVLAIGTLDTVNELPLALKLVRYAMKAEGLFLGAFSGADTLPQLRAAMRAADSVAAIASPHAHPRIEAAAVGPLLDAAGFAGAVIDVDRIEVRYLSLEKLIADLRRMGTTNILADRSRLPLTRAAYEAAKDHFRQSARDGRTAEIFEVLHFACHAPQQS